MSQRVHCLVPLAATPALVTVIPRTTTALGVDDNVRLPPTPLPAALASPLPSVTTSVSRAPHTQTHPPAASVGPADTRYAKETSHGRHRAPRGTCAHQPAQQSIQNLTQTVFSLWSILAHQCRLRGDECPFVIAHIARIWLSFHVLLRELREAKRLRAGTGRFIWIPNWCASRFLGAGVAITSIFGDYVMKHARCSQSFAGGR